MGEKNFPRLVKIWRTLGFNCFFGCNTLRANLESRMWPLMLCMCYALRRRRYFCLEGSNWLWVYIQKTYENMQVWIVKITQLLYYYVHRFANGHTWFAPPHSARRHYEVVHLVPKVMCKGGWPHKNSVVANLPFSFALYRRMEICGPIAIRWLYPTERVMGHLKRYVQNRSTPKGSMVIGYALDYALGFITSYMKEFVQTAMCV